MRLQASLLSIPHETIPVEEPYRDSYIRALRVLEQRGISMIVTGDIDLVDGYPNWIQECSADLDLRVSFPLWKAPRETLLCELIERGIVAEISYINDNRIPGSWLHRIIDTNIIEDLKKLRDATGIDMCGEKGQYHTMVQHFP